jgi:Flp pilus assembly protein CpaB
MEMEYKDPSKRGRFIVVLGLLLAIVAGGAAFYLVNNATNAAKQQGTAVVAAVVAAGPIQAGKPVAKEQVAVNAEIPASMVDPKLLFAKPEDVIGLSLAIDVPTGQVLTRNMLGSATAGLEFTILPPLETVAPDSEAWRAISISVPDDRAVGGVLGPKMKVDVIVTSAILTPYDAAADPEGGAADATPRLTPRPVAYYAPGTGSKVTYQDMQILTRNGTFYVLKVPLRVAEEMAHLQTDGAVWFSLALRPEQDTRILDASSLGATTSRIIERYGLPYVELFPAPGQATRTNPPIPSLTPAPVETPAPADGGGASPAAPTPAPTASPAG